jgi:hypothetical protein
MSIVGFVILVLLVLIGIWIFVKLAALPGQKAAERGHPQAEAINVLGWIGLLLGVAPWLIALVWAYTKPPVLQPTSPATESADAANDNN